jgi:hypothetical protein
VERGVKANRFRGFGGFLGLFAVFSQEPLP